MRGYDCDRTSYESIQSIISGNLQSGSIIIGSVVSAAVMMMMMWSQSILLCSDVRPPLSPEDVVCVAMTMLV